MHTRGPWLMALVTLLTGDWAFGQESPPAKEALPPPKLAEAPPLPPADAVAATVNGQPIKELAVHRALARERPKNWDEARREVINYLVEITLIDQYLNQLKIHVEPKEVTEKIEQLKKEAESEKQDFKKIMESLHLSEEELRQQMTGALRWDKFASTQANDKNLEDYFEKNKIMFDGSQVSARHILIKAATAEPKAQEEAKSKILVLKKQIEGQVAQELAKLPPNTPPLDREKERIKQLTQSFATAAMKESACPSKAEGGSLGYFPRAGAMVEPFARAAFALKPSELSDVVSTEFGYHLILAVDHKPGKEVKYKEVKPLVQEIYLERLRDAIIAQLKPRARIEIHPAPKK
jgi:peptidyl-prolyl cis-trans isomerase C